MQQLLTNDCENYLKGGVLSQPFLDDDYVLQRVMCDFERKILDNPRHTKIESLCNWIHHSINSTTDSELKNKYKFQRTAKEIWESGFATGCTDWALLFATLARQIGIPTTFLHTAEKTWVEKLKNDKDLSPHVGHSFCECFYEGKWVLVDPTFRKIEEEYDCEQIKLSYSIPYCQSFLPYFRGLDLGKRQSVAQHNREMDEECTSLFVE